VVPVEWAYRGSQGTVSHHSISGDHRHDWSLHTRLLHMTCAHTLDARARRGRDSARRGGGRYFASYSDAQHSVRDRALDTGTCLTRALARSRDRAVCAVRLWARTRARAQRSLQQFGRVCTGARQV